MHVDSDCAGEKRSRKSCSGGILMVKGADVQTWSKMQRHIALRSGEAKSHAAAKGISEGVGFGALVPRILPVRTEHVSSHRRQRLKGDAGR